MTADFDVVVIGAGVIGISIARALAEQGLQTLLLEREQRFGTGASTRNTGCIHAGVYYHDDSLKGRLCKRGREMLYAFCVDHGIGHRKTGKLFIVTADEFLPGLDKLLAQGARNGISDLVELDSRAIKAREPHLDARAGLFCPHSGIVDTHELMLTLLGMGEAAGLTYVAGAPVEAAEQTAGGWRLHVGGQDAARIDCRAVVNAAGIWGLALSRAVFPGRAVPEARPSKGSFLRYDAPAPLATIVYPDLVPGVITERVDATPGLDGKLRFGPSVDETASAEDYDLPDDLVQRMAPVIRAYLPDLDENRLVPEFAGVRPKIAAPGGGLSDFMFDWASEDSTWLDLWGMESPGLTSCLAIAEHTQAALQERIH
jgi:L-2-hydroxyglutarate oxidase LhgO